MGPLEIALRGTRARLEKYGWVPRNAGNDPAFPEPGCVINHMAAVLVGADSRVQDGCYNLLRDIIGEKLIGGWNDRQQSVVNVYRVLDLAADTANERGL